MLLVDNLILGRYNAFGSAYTDRTGGKDHYGLDKDYMVYDKDHRLCGKDHGPCDKDQHCSDKDLGSAVVLLLNDNI